MNDERKLCYFLQAVKALLRRLYLLFLLTLLRKVISFITIGDNKHSCAKIKPLCRRVVIRLPFTTEFLFYVTSLRNLRHVYKKTMVFQVACKSISFGLKKEITFPILRNRTRFHALSRNSNCLRETSDCLFKSRYRYLFA